MTRMTHRPLTQFYGVIASTLRFSIKGRSVIRVMEPLKPAAAPLAPINVRLGAARL
jgi:hypothetical protein